MLSQLKRTSFLARFLFNNHNIACFSKEAKVAKGDAKGGAPAAPTAPVITQPKLQQLVQKWIRPNHSPLSPSQLKMLNEGFDDLSAADKQMLEKLATKMLDLPTAILYDVLKKGGLGTSELYYTSVDQISDVQIPSTLKILRKEI